MSVPALLRALVLVLLAGATSSCVVTGLVTTHYFYASGGMDHDARVASAWRGPAGELALELVDLEGVYHHRDVQLVFTADELEQMFAGTPSTAPQVLPVPHVPMPRAVLERGLTLPRPAEGAPEFVPVATWEWRVEENGVRRAVLPESRGDAPFTVHWTHHYRSGAPEETGFALLLTRRGPAGEQHALVLPAAFHPPFWPNLVVGTAILLDLTWMVLLFS